MVLSCRMGGPCKSNETADYNVSDIPLIPAPIAGKSAVKNYNDLFFHETVKNASLTGVRTSVLHSL